MTDGKFLETLVFVSGSTPQIITETIYALARKEAPVWADEIYVITTSLGKRRIKDSLEQNGVLQQLIEEHAPPETHLPDLSFLIIKNDSGNEIEDIRTESENSLTGDVIVSCIRDLSEDPGRRIHCCLAGGRKTMSFYLGAALQLFGRPWDRLYHVLITPEFESLPEFFYKPKKSRLIEWKLPDGSSRLLNTDDAEITLAELPYIRLRDKLDLRGKGFSELVAEGQQELDTATVQPELRIDVAERTVRIGDRLLEMVPVHLMLYLAFLRQKLESCKRPDQPYCLDCTGCFQTLGEMVEEPALARMGRDYQAIYGGSPGKAHEILKNWNATGGINLIRQGRSKINRAIEECLADTTLAPRFVVSSIRRWGDTRYGVRAEKGKMGVE